MPPALNRKSISPLLTAAGREKLLISDADLCKSPDCLRSTCLIDICVFVHALLIAEGLTPVRAPQHPLGAPPPSWPAPYARSDIRSNPYFSELALCYEEKVLVYGRRGALGGQEEQLVALTATRRDRPPSRLSCNRALCPPCVCPSGSSSTTALLLLAAAHCRCHLPGCLACRQ
jgi:hypothetical protein